jgi:hypothetical protein
VSAAGAATPDRRTGARREVLATLAIVGGLAALAGGRSLAHRLARRPTPERCVAMLERYTEQEARMRGRVPTGTPVPLGAPEVARCTRELTDAEVTCALASGYADELDRCFP